MGYGRLRMSREEGYAGGDATWIARSNRNGQEWVLDYIIERKNVDDLFSSIKSTRYEQQKYWLKRCGLRHLMYLVEGNPDQLSDGKLWLFICSGNCATQEPSRGCIRCVDSVLPDVLTTTERPLNVPPNLVQI